jgi:large subunit ribosomal protein L22
VSCCAFAATLLPARARGRAGRVEKYFSNLTVIVRERAEEATAE